MSSPSRSHDPTSSSEGSRRLRLVGVVGVAAVLLAAGAFLALSSTAESDGTHPDTASSDAGGSEEADAEQAPTTDTDGQADEASPAPDVAFEHFDDSQPARLDDWAGEPVVVNFWASWCPPCVAEMRDAFEPVHQDLGDQVTFLGVNLQDSRNDALDVVERTGVTYQLARDPDGELFTAFGGFGMPLTALVDEHGEVVADHTGALTHRELEALVRDHLLGG